MLLMRLEPLLDVIVTGDWRARWLRDLLDRKLEEKEWRLERKEAKEKFFEEIKYCSMV